MLKKQKGFTLIELVLTFMIVVMVFGVLSTLVSLSTRFFTDENTQVFSQEALRIVTVNFEKDLRKYVTTSDFFTKNTSTTSHVYVLGDNATSNKVTYTYDTNTNEIYRDSVLIASNVASFDVSIVLSSVPYVDLTIISIPDNRGITNEIDLTIYLRIERAG